MLADQIKAELLGLEPVSGYRGPLGFARGGWQSVMKKTVKIKPLRKDLSKYQKIVLVAPIWAGFFPPPVRSFLSENKNKINRLSLFSVSAQGEKNEKAVKEMEKFRGKKFKVCLLLSSRQFMQKDLKNKIGRILKKV